MNEIPPTPKSTSLPLVIGLSVLLGALLAGGGVYAYQRAQLNAAKDDLQAQIQDLKDQLAASPTPTASALPTATPVATASATAGTATATPLASCASTLKPTLSNGEGTAGTYYYRLTVTNSGSSTCTVSSQPPVLVPLDSAGKELGNVITDYDAKHVTQLTVAPGGKVYSRIGFPNSANFSNAQCKSMQSLRLDMNANALHLTLSDIASLNPGYTNYFCNNNLSTGEFSTTAP